jgi:hypothetical protein
LSPASTTETFVSSFTAGLLSALAAFSFELASLFFPFPGGGDCYAFTFTFFSPAFAFGSGYAGASILFHSSPSSPSIFWTIGSRSLWIAPPTRVLEVLQMPLLRFKRVAELLEYRRLLRRGLTTCLTTSAPAFFASYSVTVAADGICRDCTLGRAGRMIQR